MNSEKVRIAIPVQADKAETFIRVLNFVGADAEAVPADCDADAFDGMLLPGGGDIDPVRYGEEMDGSDEPDRELDAWQDGVLAKFAAAGKPVFAACRGAQVVNVHFGGTLVQDLPEKKDHARAKPGDPFKVHITRALPDSFVAVIYGTAPAVNSNHHQAVKALGRGLRAVQWSPDGVVEALEHETLPIYSVQWHPELMCLERAQDDFVDGAAILRWFVDKCMEYKKRSSR